MWTHSGTFEHRKQEARSYDWTRHELNIIDLHLFMCKGISLQQQQTNQVQAMLQLDVSSSVYIEYYRNNLSVKIQILQNQGMKH